MNWRSFPVPHEIRLTEMFTIFTRHRELGYSFPGETHNFWECLYIRAGSVRVNSDEKTYLLSSGDIVFHKPMELHKYDVLSRDGADIMVFSFSAEGSLHLALGGRAFSPRAEGQALLHSLFEQVQAAKQEGGVSSLHTVETLAQNPANFSSVASKIELLMHALSSSAQRVSSVEGGSARIFGEIVLYMKENIEKNLSLKDLSEEFFIGTSTLKRIFKQNSGLGVHSYFLKLKLAAAAELLSAGKSVAETALELGFPNSAYFATVFRREMGIPPKNFKLKTK